MQLIQSQLAAATAERDDFEAKVWKRIGGPPHPNLPEAAVRYFPDLLERGELSVWRALCSAVDQLESWLKQLRG